MRHGCYDETLIIPTPVHLYATVAYECMIIGETHPEYPQFYVYGRIKSMYIMHRQL